jgi:hypothetical protein
VVLFWEMNTKWYMRVQNLFLNVIKTHLKKFLYLISATDEGGESWKYSLRVCTDFVRQHFLLIILFSSFCFCL